jgi:transcriptional regulator with XRE-family HTH domain
MTTQEIKALMKQRGLTNKKLSKRFGVHHCTVTFLVQGTLRSERLEKRLARALGLTVEELRKPAPAVETI